MITDVHKSSRKVPAILVGYQSNLNFFDRFVKNDQIPNFMKIRLVVPCGKTDRHYYANSGFTQFCERI